MGWTRAFWGAFSETNQVDAYLPPHRKSACRPIAPQSNDIMPANSATNFAKDGFSIRFTRDAAKALQL